MQIQQLFLLASLLVTVLAAAAATPPKNLSQAPNLSEILLHVSDEEPGCAISVSDHGATFHIEKGLSNLEHSIPINSSTVFEAGSVAKQFTAAAIMLLVLDGELKIDDPIDKYFPELPSYAKQITIQMLINHTSGLRDWGVVAAISGAARGTHIYTPHDVIAILERQQSLNHLPGEFFSYTNSGYSLLAILVERISGKPFGVFTHERLFSPLNMTQTQWRTNFEEVIPNRATAYKPAKMNWQSQMPFENVVGNGGLLTTTRDLLKFSQALHHSDHFDPKFRALMYRLVKTSSGQPLNYASGIVIGKYLGHSEMSHGGSTAGYRAYLADYPDSELTIAVLCNRANALTAKLTHNIADLFLAPLDEPDPAAGVKQTATELFSAGPRAQTLAGGYQLTQTGQVIEVNASGELLVIFQQEFSPTSLKKFVSATGSVLEVDLNTNSATFTDPHKVAFRMERLSPWETTRLADYVGLYASAEANTRYRVSIRNGDLTLTNQDNSAQKLVPTHRDQFLIEPTQTRLSFVRDGIDNVVGARLSTGRVWNMQFNRLNQQ